MSFEIYSFKGSNKFFDGVISFGFTTGENDERSYASTVTLMGTTLFSKDHGPLLTGKNVYSSFTLDVSEIYPLLTVSSSGTLFLTVSAYDFSGGLVEARSASLTLFLRETEELLPTFSLSISPENTFGEHILQGMSVFRVKVEEINTKLGATLGSITASYEGAEYDITDSLEALLPSPYGFGEIKIDITVTDSRGFSGTASEAFTVTPYSPPRLVAAETESDVVCARCDAEGVESDGGSYLKIKARAQYTRLQGNEAKISYAYKADSSSVFGDYVEIAADGSALLGGLLPTVNYTVLIKVSDTVGGYSVISRKISTESVYLHKAGELNSLGIGGMVQKKDTVYLAPHMRVEVAGENWISLGLQKNSANTTDVGRAGVDCAYLVAAGGHHVYIAFDNYVSVGDVVNAEAIPKELRPLRSIFSVCYGYHVDHKLIGVEVNTLGEVRIIWVFNLEDGAYESDGNALFVDGYIDYWIWEE